MLCRIWLVSMGLSSKACKRRAMVSRRRADIHDLLDDQLRRFDATEFIDVQAVCQLNDAAVSLASLVERNRIQWRSTACRPDPHLEVILANDPLVHDIEIAGKHRLRKPRAPG